MDKKVLIIIGAATTLITIHAIMIKKLLDMKCTCDLEDTF